MAIAFLSLTFSTAVTLTGQPAFTFTLPPSVDPTKGPLFVGFFDPTVTPAAWQLGIEGPGVVTGTTVAFAGTTTPVTYGASLPYGYVLYQAQGVIPTPTPVPNVPSTVTLSPATSVFTGDQGTQSPKLAISVKDATGAEISGTYSVPVVLSVSDTGAHTLLSVGGTPATSVSVTSSTDAAALAVSYDGKGGAGYSATISAASPAAAATLNAMTVSATPGYTELTGDLLSIANHTATFTVSEANFTGAFTLTPSTACTDGTAAVTSPIAAGVFTVVGGLTTANCTLTVGDGTFSYPVINVQNTVDGASPVPIPTPTSPTGTGGGGSTPLPLPSPSSSPGSVGSSPTPLPLPT